MQNNQVAIRRNRTGQKLVVVNGHQYVFGVRANITLAWINEEDVDTILKQTESCCGGTKRIGYFRASEDDIRRWTNNGGR